MALPIQATPTYTTVLPVSGQTIEYRPFLVKEQKLLMMAQESKNDAEYIQKLVDGGMIVNEVTPENMLKFREAVAPMYVEYQAKINPELFKMIDAANAAAK